MCKPQHEPRYAGVGLSVLTRLLFVKHPYSIVEDSPAVRNEFEVS